MFKFQLAIVEAFLNDRSEEVSIHNRLTRSELLANIEVAVEEARRAFHGGNRRLLEAARADCLKMLEYVKPNLAESLFRLFCESISAGGEDPFDVMRTRETIERLAGWGHGGQNSDRFSKLSLR